MKYPFIVVLAGLNHFDLELYRFNDLTKNEALMETTRLLVEQYTEMYADDPTSDDLIIAHAFGSTEPIKELL